MPQTTVFTIGHSTRTIDEFLALLAAHGIRELVDIRSIPKSRRHPHFGGEALREALTNAGIEYIWMKALGGRRRPSPDSQNDAWRNDAFRGYADHMQSAEFKAAVDELVKRSRSNDLVIMCAEAVPWRCHRSLVGDALLVRNVAVRDIMSEKKAPAHALTSFARVEGTNLTYPADPPAERIT